jgi:uncharacterized membrane protein
MRRRIVRRRALSRWALATLYLAAGTLHLVMPTAFLPIMPDFVPFPVQVILVTGICEIAGAVGLLTRIFRRPAGIALAVYAVCVFPANIKHAVDDLTGGHGELGWWYHGPRLVLQPVLVWWALFGGEVVDWPFAPSARRRPGPLYLDQRSGGDPGRR